MTAHPIQYESTEQAAQREQNATPPFLKTCVINQSPTKSGEEVFSRNDSFVGILFRAALPQAFTLSARISGSLVFLPVQRAGRAYSMEAA